jgi:ADP-ribose pyrophosphatase YjhB (NUDIX family)
MEAQTVVCVAALVRKGDSILLVRQASGHSLQGQWTVPWGRLEAGESPAAAALIARLLAPTRIRSITSTRFSS